MMGCFLARVLLMVFGYVYPAYECYKTVERHEHEIDKLEPWCKYWILVALFTVYERISDNIMSWLPLYDEAKLAFLLYLWLPKTRGTVYVYGSFLRPYLLKHENKIDLNLLNMRSKAALVANLVWQKALTYGRYTFFDVLQYVSALSASRSQPNQELSKKEK